MNVRKPRVILLLNLGDHEEQIYFYEGDDIRLLA